MRLLDILNEEKGRRNKKEKKYFLVFLEAKVLSVVCFRIGFSQFLLLRREENFLQGKTDI